MSIHDISTERAQQSTRFGVDNDDRWTPGEWAALISHYATRSVVGDLGSIDLQKFRQDVVKAGALVLACLESIDRRGAQ